MIYVHCLIKLPDFRKLIYLLFSANIENLLRKIKFSRIWSSAQDYAVLFDRVLHFCLTKMVRRKCVVPVRYWHPKGKLAGLFFTYFYMIHMVGRDRGCDPVFWFLVCYAATQLALQLQQERTQVVRSAKVVRRIPAESNSTPAICTWNRSCSWVSWYVCIIDTHLVWECFKIFRDTKGLLLDYFT